MSGSQGKSQGRFIMDEEQEREHGSTEDPTKTPEESRRRGSSSSTNSTNGWTGRDGSLTAVGEHSSTTTASQPKGEAAVVPAAGGGASPEEHNNRVEDQQTLREQLEALVSHKLRTLGDLDQVGLAALEALNKLPAARGQPPPPAIDGAKKKILPLGLEKIKKFSGKEPHYLTDCLNQFYSLVVAALPTSSPGSVNRALTRDVVFVLEGSALKFFNSLKAGHVQWEATPPGGGGPDERAEQGGSSSHPQQQQQQQEGGGKRFRPPSLWTELYEAFHDHYLPVTGIARTSEKLFSSTQAPDESVLSLAQRQLGLATHLHRLIEANGKQIDFMEAISIRLFERALRADLRRIQDAEPPCSSFQESVDRAERNAIKLAKKPDSSAAQHNDGIIGSGASSAPAVALPIARCAVASSEGGGVLSAAIPKHAIKSDPDGSERDGREERSSPAAPQGRNAVGSDRDAGHEAGEILPPDDGSRSSSTWQEEPGGGEGEEGPGFENRHKKPRRGKRRRDWPEMQHSGGGQDRPFPSPQCARLDDPGASPPCTLPECRSINRQFHCSNDCYYHPIHGERNKTRGNYGRRKGSRRSQPDHRGPQQHHNGGFFGQQ